MRVNFCHDWSQHAEISFVRNSWIFSYTLKIHSYTHFSYQIKIENWNLPRHRILTLLAPVTVTRFQTLSDSHSTSIQWFKCSRKLFCRKLNGLRRRRARGEWNYSICFWIEFFPSTQQQQGLNGTKNCLFPSTWNNTIHSRETPSNEDDKKRAEGDFSWQSHTREIPFSTQVLKCYTI